MCDLTPDHVEVFDDSSLAPSSARAFVRQHGCPEHGTIDTQDALLLLTSELVTNSVLYARPPIAVHLSCLATEVRLAVSDAGPRLPGEHQTSAGLGLGLVIVSQIAKDWGSTFLDRGTEVWCRVHIETVPVGNSPWQPKGPDHPDRLSPAQP